MQADNYINKVAHCFVKYINQQQVLPLDFDLWFKILDCEGNVYDFKKGEYRPAQPEHRMLRHLPRPFKEWDAPATLKDTIVRFSECVRSFFMAGGTDFDPTDQLNFNVEAERLRKECLSLWSTIVAAPESVMIKALMTVLARDKTDEKVIDYSDINEIVYILRNDSRVLASHNGLVGMLAYTGPKNGGKSWINQRLVQFLGDREDVHQAGARQVFVQRTQGRQRGIESAHGNIQGQEIDFSEGAAGQACAARDLEKCARSE